MVSFSIPPAHQGRRMQQATENPEYENEIQEAMNGPHPGRFQSIRAAATAWRVSLFSNAITPLKS